MNNFLLKMDANGCIDSVIEQEGFTIQSNQYIFDIFDGSKEEVMHCIHDSEVFMQFYYFTIKDSAKTHWCIYGTKARNDLCAGTGCTGLHEQSS